MPSYYVWSGAGGSANGSSWANAYTTLTAAFVPEAAGDTLYVAHDHAESTAAAITLTSSGTSQNPTTIVCVNRAGTVPPVSADVRATATVSTTLASNITLNGGAHYDGIIFNAGSAANQASILPAQTGGSWIRFDNCSLRLTNTSASSTITIGAAGTGGLYAELNNTTISFGNTAHVLTVYGRLRWRNTPSALLGTMPTTLISPGGSRGAGVELSGVDLSALGSGKSIIGAGAGASQGGQYNIYDCKLDAAVTLAQPPAAFGSLDIDFVRSSASGNVQMYRARMSGSIVDETTIVRSGGASDGTTTISWKAITTTHSSYAMPLECPPIAIWNDVTGSAVTATVEGIAATLPTDQDVWLDVEYLGDASSPQASFVHDGKAMLATAANQTSSGASWGGSTAAFKLAVTFTAQQKGWIYARVKCAKASSTFYIDPLVTLT